MLLATSLCLQLSLMSVDGGGGAKWTPREALKIESQSWPGAPPDG